MATFGIWMGILVLAAVVRHVHIESYRAAKKREKELEKRIAALEDKLSE